MTATDPLQESVDRLIHDFRAGMAQLIGSVEWRDATLQRVRALLATGDPIPAEALRDALLPQDGDPGPGTARLMAEMRTRFKIPAPQRTGTP